MLGWVELWLSWELDNLGVSSKIVNFDCRESYFQLYQIMDFRQKSWARRSMRFFWQVHTAHIHNTQYEKKHLMMSLLFTTVANKYVSRNCLSFDKILEMLSLQAGIKSGLVYLHLKYMAAMYLYVELFQSN